MCADEEGFLYPTIDKDLCVHCGLCEKVCPVIHNEICGSNKYSLAGYIVRDKRVAVLADSTSGGFFTALAEYVLERGGHVYGAAFDDVFRVHHISVDMKENISKLRGSKYVASDLEGSFEDVLKDLKNGIYVLFTGCPCQIAGLKSFLRQDYEKLITMDVVCHGTPSPLFWKKHLDFQQKKNKQKIKSICVRHKTYGYHSGAMMLEFENGKRVYESARTNYYLKAFFGDLCSKPHCYNCSFKHEEHCSEFTVYDAWHAGELAGIEDDDRGWTNLIVQSVKGQALFEELKDRYRWYCVDYKKAIELDGIMVNNSVTWNKGRESFFIGMENEPFQQHCAKFIRVSILDLMIEKMKKIYYWKKAQ